jgi:glucarate dehydratase
MRITDVKSYTVAVPFQAPLKSAFGISYPARVRTFIEVETDSGLTGIGETGPDALHNFNRDDLLTRFEKAIKPALLDENPYDYRWLKRKLRHRSEATAVEIACWDIMAQASGIPLYRLLGANHLCESVPVAGYCFFHAPGPNGTGAVTLENFCERSLQIMEAGGYNVLKAKLGVYSPSQECEIVIRLREMVGPDVELRIDPNGSWSLPSALRVLKRLEHVDLEYIEEPVRSSGPADATTATHNLRRLRSAGQTPIAADHCYRPDLLAQIIRDAAADVVLADVFGCGGIANTVQYCRTAVAFGLGVSIHSGTELCVGQVAKIHIQAALNDIIAYASDAIYPHYVDGVLTGGKLAISNGKMCVPQSPGLGVTLDKDRLAKWELTQARHRELDIFWEQTKADAGVTLPEENLLVWQH